jgi:hypothetical protein
MPAEKDASKDMVTCLHCVRSKAKKTEYRKKYLSDHTKTKHPGEKVQYKLSAVLATNKTITHAFAVQAAASAIKPNREEYSEDSEEDQTNEKPGETADILSIPGDCNIYNNIKCKK